MTVPSGVFLPVGARMCRIYELNQETGLIKATSMTPYLGALAQGVRTVTPNWTAFRVIDFAGDDILQQRDFLPPITGGALTLGISTENFPVQAILTGTKVNAGIGEANRSGILTSKQGYEPNVGVFVFQQGVEGIYDANGNLNAVAGARRWRALEFPQAVFSVRPQGMGENVLETTYEGTPRVVTRDMLGIGFTEAVDGFLFTQALNWQFTFKPIYSAWLSDGTATYNFDANHLPAYASKVAVSVNGVRKFPIISATSFTLSPAPTTGDTVIALYEWGSSSAFSSSSSSSSTSSSSSSAP